MAFLSATAILSYAVGPLCLPAMRQLIPAQPRPFKLPYSTLFCYIAFCICNFMLHWSGFTVLWKLNVALVLALSIHMIYKKHWNILQDYSLLWFISYMVILLLISYVGPFGGLNIIIFPYDIYLITFVSILIFYWSQHCLSQDKDIPEQIQTIKQAIG
jgi:amino acid transporter